MGRKDSKTRKQQKIFPAHNKTLDEVCDVLATDLKLGLSRFEVDRRLNLYGENNIPPVKGNIWEIYFSPLFNWLINIYLIVSIILFILAFWVPSTWSQLALWIGIIVFNIAFAVVQQVRATFKLDALHQLSAPTSTLIREGMVETIKADYLVPGDLIQLDAGDRVPADSRIVEAYNCLVNESSLTGESLAVEKTSKPGVVLDEDILISDRVNMLYLGTFLESGKALAIVVNTGLSTELGKLSSELEVIGSSDIPIRNKVNKLAKWLGITVIIYLVISVTYKIIIHATQGTITNTDLVLNDIVISITTSMAIMPITIPLLTTIILLTGVLSMAKERIIIRNLSAIETLGRCSILCTDKTGTITSNQQTIQRVWDTEELFGVSGLGYSNKGSIFPIDPEPSLTVDIDYIPDSITPYYADSNLENILIGGLLNNDAHLIVEEVFEPFHQVSWRTTGDPTDGAFLALFNKSGLNENEKKEIYKPLVEYPFDSTIKRMSRLFKKSGNQNILFCKGASETVLQLCTHIGVSNQEFSENEKKKVLDYINAFAGMGYRVISLAYKNIDDSSAKEMKRNEIEKELVYNGFVCMLDPPRYGTKESVGECYKAGVTPIMITGDSLLTAKAIATNINIIKGKEGTVEGSQIERIEDEDFYNTRVFARVSPQHKQVIIEKYQAQDKIIAMTGDGVNDALALAISDVGIAMGITGTDVAKQASDVVISDDSFGSTIRGIREGRGLFEKIRLMIFFFITLNIAEAIIYFTGSFILNFALLNNFQRVIIFTTAHALPPMAIVFDKIADEIMDSPPRDNEEIFNKRYLGALIVVALSLAFSAGLIYLLAINGVIKVSDYNLSGITPILQMDSGNILDSKTLNHAKARTMFLTILIFTESFMVLSFRRFNKSLFKSLKEDFNWLAIFFVIVVPLVFLIVMYIPPLQHFLTNTLSVNLELLPLSIIDWLILIIVIIFPIIALEAYKWTVRKKQEYF